MLGDAHRVAVRAPGVVKNLRREVVNRVQRKIIVGEAEGIEFGIFEGLEKKRAEQGFHGGVGRIEQIVGEAKIFAVGFIAYRVNGYSFNFGSGVVDHSASVRGLVVVPVIRNLTTVEKKSKRVLLRIVTQKSFQSKIKEKSPDGSGGNFTNTNTNATKEPED